jgi:hypothetical protein
MNIAICIPTMDVKRAAKCIGIARETSKHNVRVFVHRNGMPLITQEWVARDAYGDSTGADIITASAKNIGVTPALHELYLAATGPTGGFTDDDFLLFIHDDTFILDLDWDVKVKEWLAERPNAALFGFGGARGLGDPDLYQKPYVLSQLARRDFISNMRDAECHGRRVTEPTQVATLDLFAIGARVSFLKSIDGWNFWPHVHHGLDNAICCEAARQRREVWVFPIACHHAGGLTSTRVDFNKDFGEAEGKIHSDGHVTLYEDYRDVLPLMVEGGL